jgi:NADPH-dependent 2,4-dienoyl-CoA reductase/sulfur reductase-like enzyme
VKAAVRVHDCYKIWRLLVPSRILRTLRTLRSNVPFSTMSIHLIVIGAGLAGLAAAISTKVANPEHQVTILESVRELAEIGVSSSSHPPLSRRIPV